MEQDAFKRVRQATISDEFVDSLTERIADRLLLIAEYDKLLSLDKLTDEQIKRCTKIGREIEGDIGDYIPARSFPLEAFTMMGDGKK